MGARKSSWESISTALAACTNMCLLVQYWKADEVQINNNNNNNNMYKQNTLEYSLTIVDAYYYFLNFIILMSCAFFKLLNCEKYVFLSRCKNTLVRSAQLPTPNNNYLSYGYTNIRIMYNIVLFTCSFLCLSILNCLIYLQLEAKVYHISDEDALVRCCGSLPCNIQTYLCTHIHIFCTINS